MFKENHKKCLKIPKNALKLHSLKKMIYYDAIMGYSLLLG